MAADFINGFEGIAGYEDFRSDLAVMYLPSSTEPTAISCRSKSCQCRSGASGSPSSSRDAAWLYQVLARESAKLGTKVALRADSIFGIDAARR